MNVDQVREALLNADFTVRLAGPAHFQRSADNADGPGSIRLSSAEIAGLPASHAVADAARPQSAQAGTAPAAGDKAFNASSGNVIFVPLVYDPPPARDPADGFCGGWVERRVLIENYSLVADSDADADDIDLPLSLAASVTNGSLSEASFDDDLSAALGGLGAGEAALFAPDGGDQAGKIFLVVDGNGVAGYQEGEDHVFGIAGLPPTDLGGHTDFFG